MRIAFLTIIIKKLNTKLNKIDAIFKKHENWMCLLSKKRHICIPGFPAVFPGKRAMQKGWDSRESRNGKSRKVKPSAKCHAVTGAAGGRPARFSRRVI
jgi:hypothetical protein